MQSNTSSNKYFSTVRTLLPLMAFIIPMLLLYYLYPSSFEKTWKGRTYQLFFVWLVSMEIISSWEKLQTIKLSRLLSPRTLAFGLTLALPTVYTFLANFFGLNEAIVNWALQFGVREWWAAWMPLTIEYLVFAALFLTINLIAYGKQGLTLFSISTSLLIAIGFIYTIDNLYPEGQFTPFQIIVPTTAKLAMSILNILGYHTLYLGSSSNMPAFMVWDSHGNHSEPFAIAWPCSGIESLLIYCVTILLFLKRSTASWTAKTAYFAIGAVTTYFINALRIATIYIISLNKGEWGTFHDNYGQLYSITWIITYPLMIIGAQSLWSKIRNLRETKRNKRKQTEDETRIYS